MKKNLLSLKEEVKNLKKELSGLKSVLLEAINSDFFQIENAKSLYEDFCKVSEKELQEIQRTIHCTIELSTMTKIRNRIMKPTEKPEEIVHGGVLDYILGRGYWGKKNPKQDEVEGEGEIENIYLDLMEQRGLSGIIDPYSLGIVTVQLIDLDSNQNRVYIGEIQDGKRNGLGFLYERSISLRLGFIKKYNTSNYNRIFIGEFKDGKRHGKGKSYNTQTSTNFLIYDGQYFNGLRHGRGEYYDSKKGIRVIGNWENGKLFKESIIGSYHCHEFDYKNEVERHINASKIIGLGGYGAVYKIKASLIPTLRPLVKREGLEFVAVKIIKVDVSTPNYYRFRIFDNVKRSIRLISSLEGNNKNFVRIHGIFESVGEDWRQPLIGYVMDYAGQSVDSLIGGSRGENFDRMVNILYQTAVALSHLHSKNVIHRDLKWPNVLIDDDGVVRVTDIETMTEDQSKWRFRNLTATTRVGTTGYLAPEVLSGKKYSGASDVYSYGMMIYSLLWNIIQPYNRIELTSCNCNQSVQSIISTNKLDYHIANCHLRPYLANKELKRYPRFLTDIMQLCWDEDTFKRPTFRDIVCVFDDYLARDNIIKNRNSSSLSVSSSSPRCYSIIQFRFPRHQRLRRVEMFLVEPNREKIVEWLRRKYVDSKVLSLIDRKRGSVIQTDKDVLLLISSSQSSRKLSKPIIEVEFDSIHESKLERRVFRRVKISSRQKSIVEKSLRLERENEMLEQEIRRRDEKILKLQTMNEKLISEVKMMKSQLSEQQSRCLEEEKKNNEKI